MPTPEYLILVVSLDVDDLGGGQLPPRAELGTLPHVAAHALSAIADGLSLERLYLLKADTKLELQGLLETQAIDYHRYATTERREVCQRDECAEHVLYDNVVRLPV